jgi:protein-disulfide isomerase
MSDLRAPVMSSDHVRGAAHAPVTVVEYADFECPNCKQAAPAVSMLLAKYTGQVRVVFRHFPLEAAHPHALAAAEAAESAGAQGRFWEMHDLLFEHQDHLRRRDLEGYAARLQLDGARFAAELDDEIYRQRIREHMEGAVRSGVRSTPGFFVNGRIQDVSFGLRGLFDAVEASLQQHR